MQHAPQRFFIDLSSLTITNGERYTNCLTAKEIQIFSLLEGALDQTLTRKHLLQKIWNATVVSSKTLDVHIFNLRRKLATIGLEIRFIAPDNFKLISTAPSTARTSEA